MVRRNLTMKTKIDYAKLIQKINGVDQLISIGLIKPVISENKIYFDMAICWGGKNRKFKKNWCKNLFIYVGVKTGKNFNTNKKLEFIDIVTNKLVATFNNNRVKLL